MFSGCTSLSSSPSLPAIDLPEKCYKEMFDGCSNLNYVVCFAINMTYSATLNWLNNVSTDGVFIKDKYSEWSRSNSGIPSGWEVRNYGE
jgi:hypothetical protein